MTSTDITLEPGQIDLSDGRAMPQLGYGVWQVPAEDAAGLVADAIKAGYRSVDTAAIYQNEEGVGAGMASAGLPRKDIFLTTKLWNADHGYDSALKACDASIRRLGVDYLDLYLIHWPKPDLDRYVESWKALIRLREDGKVRSIGVSNFLPEHLERIIGETGVTPVLNQIELHPRFQQRAVRDFHFQHDIRIESWSPLGQSTILKDTIIAGLAAKHARSPAQIVIRWHLDQGLVVIPKAADRNHMIDNLAVGDFHLDAEDMAAIASLDSPTGRIGPDPLNTPW